jgi:hypothetical protein
MPSKPTRTAIRFDRALPGQRSNPLHDGVESVQQEKPQPLQDPVAMWNIYVGLVAKRIGHGLTASDLLDPTVLAQVRIRSLSFFPR